MRDIKVLRLTDIHLGLQDLAGKRHTALVSCKAGQLYEPRLLKMRDDVAAVPGITQGRPLTLELSDADGAHDGYGYAIWFATEAVLRCPSSTPEQLAAARRIREWLITGPQELRASYATEAARATVRRTLLSQYKADLDLFPVPGGTLHQWAEAFIQAGEQLHTLLSDRADKVGGDRSAVVPLRTSAIALLNRFRGAVADEMEMNDQLPADLERQIFGYFDQLEDMRLQVIAAEKSAGKPAPAQPATPPPPSA